MGIISFGVGGFNSGQGGQRVWAHPILPLTFNVGQSREQSFIAYKMRKYADNFIRQ